MEGDHAVEWEERGDGRGKVIRGLVFLFAWCSWLGVTDGVGVGIRFLYEWRCMVGRGIPSRAVDYFPKNSDSST